MVSAIIVAAGRGTRMGANMNKVFLKLLDKEIILHTVDAFEKNKNVDEIIIATGMSECELVKELIGDNTKCTHIVPGGSTRQKSVYNGLMCAKGDIVLIHDGARALISQTEIDNVIADCKKYGAAAVGVPCKDTLKTVDDNGFILGTVDRSRTYQIQTPQAFLYDTILSAHKRAAADGIDATDDCALLERYGVKIKITEGRYDNIKITTPEDIEIAKNILNKGIKQ